MRMDRSFLFTVITGRVKVFGNISCQNFIWNELIKSEQNLQKKFKINPTVYK